ncbi:MAG: tautomerase family protein [Acidimicrobiia bacterium]|nr:tautomerase family protein [Acidimicrobiia bacterium]
MPLGTITAPQNAFADEQKQAMITNVTEVMVDVEGEPFREEVRAGNFAIGGKVVGAQQPDR